MRDSRAGCHVRLGVLDQAPIRRGATPRDAVLASVDLAKRADHLGYTRYWVAEHHSGSTFACASPEILIGRIASVTSRIRVGSGGVMLLHYAALKVAEIFRMLEALHPGRVDMGLGRGAGGGKEVVAALARGPGAVAPEEYPRHVADVLALVANRVPCDHPFHGLRAMPAGESSAVPWLLGSTRGSAAFAAQMGLAFSFAHFISPEIGPEVVRSYRDNFKPSSWLQEPMVNVGVPVICADSDGEAQRIAMSRHMVLLGHGDGGVPMIEEALAADYTAPEREYIEHQRNTDLIGGPTRVRRGLLDLAAEYRVDELLLLTVTHDYAHRARSYALLAEAFGLERGN